MELASKLSASSTLLKKWGSSAGVGEKISYVICQNCLIDTNLVLLILHLPVSAQRLVIKDFFGCQIEFGHDLHVQLSAQQVPYFSVLV